MYYLRTKAAADAIKFRVDVGQGSVYVRAVKEAHAFCSPGVLLVRRAWLMQDSNLL